MGVSQDCKSELAFSLGQEHASVGVERTIAFRGKRAAALEPRGAGWGHPVAAMWGQWEPLPSRLPVILRMPTLSPMGTGTGMGPQCPPQRPCSGRGAPRSEAALHVRSLPPRDLRGASHRRFA